MPIPDDEGRTEIPPRNTSDTEMCHCGRPLHYTDPLIEAAVRALIDRHGPNTRVIAGGRSWMVPRHYIALHGILACDLPHLGFEEVSDAL